MSPASIDCHSSAFEIINLTCIHGKPTFKAIRVLQWEIIINAQYIHSDLGEGAHGHLGLGLSPHKYALHNKVPYNYPNYPGPLVIPLGTTLHMANAMRDQPRKCICVFREVQGINHAL